MMQGLIIGVVGTTVGASAGYLLTLILTRYKLIKVPADVPFRVLPLDIIVVIVGAVLICFVATLYPSREAAKLDPVQALRYE
jgi:lipoprotein-releasing system permease protein